MRRILSVFFLSSCLLVSITEADTVRPISPDAGHVERWNWFADAVYALHKKQIDGKDIRIEKREGGYFRQPNFYVEEKFFDNKTNQLISVIQWEKKKPDLIHSIDVYIYDDKGRVARDFSALYLTHSRNAPQQTLINLHHYNGKLHAIRQFDATNNRTFEMCQGEYKGKKVDFRLGDMEILEYEGEPNTPMTTPEYKACFKGMNFKSAGKYLTPQ